MKRSIALISEESCIGCTKCIDVCPTDAIIGALHHMHTVIRDACVGCELCLPPCPVDCIEMIDLPAMTHEEKQNRALHWKQRHSQKQIRLAREKTEMLEQFKADKLDYLPNAVNARQDSIRAAVRRIKEKRKIHESTET